MAPSLYTQTDREVRYEKRQHKKVRTEISSLAQKRRAAPARNSTRGSSFFL